MSTRTHPHRRSRGEQGFTLIEVMIATMVFLIGVVGFTGAMVQASKFTGDARRELRATAVAQDLLEQTSTWSIDDARLSPTTSGVCKTDPADSAGLLRKLGAEYTDLQGCAHKEADLTTGTWSGLAAPQFVGGGAGDDTYERYWIVHEEDRDGAAAAAGAGARKRVWAVALYKEGGKARRVILSGVRVRTTNLGL